MKKLGTKILTSLLALLLLVGVGVSIKSQVSTNELKAATAQTHRRVYVVLKGDWDNRDGDHNRMFIHYWGGSSGTDWGSGQQMTRVNDTYWRGMFFYDLAIDVTDFLVKAYAGDVYKNSNQSENISISSIFPSGDFKVPFIGGWENDGAKRSVDIDEAAPVGDDEAANVLSYIDSCSSSYSGGYNAHPQLKKLFIDCSALDPNTVVNEQGGRPSTTIGEKCAYLKLRHDQDQASALNIVITPDLRNKNILIVLMSLLGISVISFLFVMNKKKAYN